ncbi:enoyl-CoA hydratase/isomerase family protein [Bacillus massiliigorillae]|uniref:enoyl-CoA hydratase/isomerase family protein n=1 Tax=Bacillus massiliigorillae TaxID=1243664 RepID=UPI0003A709CB|nr:enoyl-CoA hydratase/isomerase family protein [Bacillus massiliigorillae]
MSQYEPVIRFEKDEQIAIITLNRPDKLNAFSVEMRDQLYEIICIVRDDPTIHAVVLCGEGRGFCAGADLTEFGTNPTVIQKRRIRLQRDLWEEIRRLPKPIAVALHGFAVGSGLEMAMLCDFRFATPGTQLALPEAKLGMLPAAGGTQSLPRLVSQGLALDFAFSGHRITAEEGYKKKLISKIVAKEELLDTVIQYMKTIVSQSGKSASWIKSLVANSIDISLSQGILKERVLVERSWTERRK